MRNGKSLIACKIFEPELNKVLSSDTDVAVHWIDAALHANPNQLDNFWSSDDYYGFMNTFKYGKEKITLDKYTIIEETRTCVVYNWLQYFSQDSLREEFEENGFEAQEFYSDVAGSAFLPESPDIAIVAIKAKNT